ncbi:MAG: aspartyl protease family protein [Planctomycetota bacterium]|jgi:hypothetical protein
MKRTYQNKTLLFGFVLSLVMLLTSSLAYGGIKKGWKRQEVDMRMSGGSKVKALIYPQDKPVPLRKKEKKRKKVHKEALPEEALEGLEGAIEQPIFANVVNSPPIDGFVPLVAVSITDERGEVFDIIAVNEPSIIGDPLNGSNPATDYAIGIFDTGASASIMSNAAAIQAGMFSGVPDYITTHTINISGVTGEVPVWVSEPIGIFVDGLGAIESGELTDQSGMVGEWNASVMVGMGGEPDLPTVVGSPLSVFYASEILTDDIITVSKGGEDFNSPGLRFFELGDPCIPEYSNVIPLELRPGGLAVAYSTPLDIFDPDFESPAIPSTIIGADLSALQSLFFVHRVDLYDEGEDTKYEDRFMLDTGAQITVVGNRIAANLRLNPDFPEFLVEIIDVTGAVEIYNGYYLDRLEIPALGEWLIATNVPVVLIDVASPELGTLDGIIGMNLFTEFTLLLKGGGFALQDDPYLAYEPISRIVADIAPEGGDGVVDNLDLETFVAAWMSTGNTIPPSPNWNPLCDMAPQPDGDGDVNFPDYAVFAEHWQESIP